MFYDAIENKHGLRHDPYKTLVAPRPIGWISSLDPDGVVNLAPYSFFNAVSTHPKVVFFSSEGHKDSLRNVEATGEFVCNLVPYDLREQMNQTSAALERGVDEMVFAGLEAAPSLMVKPPRVAAAPAALECKYLKTVEITDLDENPTGAMMVMGQVVGIYIDDAIVEDGMIDVTRYRPVARLGYHDYTSVETVFSMQRPA